MKSCDNSTPPTSDPHCLLFGRSMPEQADSRTSIIWMLGLNVHHTSLI